MMFVLAIFAAFAQTPPDRQVPSAVMGEMRLLEVRFDQELASDCDPRFCMSKGCTYVAHTVADRPARASLPGLGQDKGPRSLPPQEYLTQAVCTFGAEQAASAQDITALTGRLQAKLSRGWATVTVTNEQLPAAPITLSEPQRIAEPEPVVDAEPALLTEPLSADVATRELWDAMLPHVFWMFGVMLFTVAAVVLIWAYRRVGQRTAEEEMLLAELGVPEEEPEVVQEEVNVDTHAEFVAREARTWRTRLNPMNTPDPAIRSLLGGLLRSRDLPMLARAVMTFPGSLPAAFPQGGAYAATKHELATYLQTVPEDTLPSEADLYRLLNRHAVSAELVNQSDTAAIASLQEDFGAAGLADLADSLPPRLAGLVFAMSSPDMQWEVTRLLDSERVAQMSEFLLYSNRMNPAETTDLFNVASGGTAPAVRSGEVTDRGAPFEAAAALSVLLESLTNGRRQQVFDRVVTHFQGMLPAWHRDVFFSSLLMELEYEARSDLLLSIDIPALSAWLSRLDSTTRAQILDCTPTALSAAVRAAGTPSSADHRAALERVARSTLSDGFRDELARSNMAFERIVAPRALGAA